MSKEDKVDDIDDQGINDRFGLTNAEVADLGKGEWTLQFFESLKELRLVAEDLNNLASAFAITGNTNMCKKLNLRATAVLQHRNVIERIILNKQQIALDGARSEIGSLLNTLVDKADAAAHNPV